MEDLKRFEADLRGSEELRKKMDQTVLKLKETGKYHSDGELVAAAAQELGYNISVTDLEKAKAETEQLDPEALAQVSGGDSELHCEYEYRCNSDFKKEYQDEYGHDQWCLAVWHCYTLNLHTPTETHYTSCFSDYMCIWVYHKEA